MVCCIAGLRVPLKEFYIILFLESECNGDISIALRVSVMSWTADCSVCLSSILSVIFSSVPCFRCLLLAFEMPV